MFLGILIFAEFNALIERCILSQGYNMASEKLVIVESPSKARTIGKMLGSEFQILASMGHVRDLPEQSFGVDIKNNFTPQYEESKSRLKVIKQLQSEAKKAKDIYLATDPDREGEAISWHLKELLKKNSKAAFHRVTFHEITKNAISKAFQNAEDINMNLVNSQQARRVLDRLVGYQISPLLWSRVEKGISAGRVQSVALRLVCEREREITAFVPKEYWNFLIDLEASAKGSGKLFTSKLFKVDGEKLEAGNKEEADKILKAVRGSSGFRVASVETKPRKKYSPPPFITSTMQQTASGALSFSPNFTMRVAQHLYEGVDVGTGGPVGLITYMRTDSFTVAKEALASCREYIASEIGPDFVPPSPNFFKNKGAAQEAHEAIRPTDVFMTPEKVKPYLEDSQFRLYTLIWKRFVASQMSPAEQKQTTVDIMTKGSDGREYNFRTTALVTTFQGFMKMYEIDEKSEDENDMEKAPSMLAELRKNEPCFMKDLKTEQKFTEPPPRFSEATLIKELETNGIGRPSTYASILETILKRVYVGKDKGKLIPSELGFKVNDFLISSLPELFEVGFTADMELKLDKVEEGEIEWTEMLKNFYSDFSIWLEDAKNIGSPESHKAESIISLINKIQNWAPKEKRGKKTYDDEKFFKSVKEKFESSSTISANQWNALLSMALKYAEQLPDLEKEAVRNGYAAEITAHREKLKLSEEKRESSKASETDIEKYASIFTFFNSVKWGEPEKRGPRVYDDKKFFNSLKSQAESGKILSDKQMNVISRMASKYKEQITDFEKLGELLNISAPSEAEGQASAENNEAVAKYLEIMSKVSNWEEPVKKGRRIYNDKTFYESIADQHKNGRKLSDKQIAALKKLADKYSASN